MKVSSLWKGACSKNVTFWKYPFNRTHAKNIVKKGLSKHFHWIVIVFFINIKSRCFIFPSKEEHAILAKNCLRLIRGDSALAYWKSPTCRPDQICVWPLEQQNYIFHKLCLQTILLARVKQHLFMKLMQWHWHTFCHMWGFATCVAR